MSKLILDGIKIEVPENPVAIEFKSIGINERGHELGKAWWRSSGEALAYDGVFARAFPRPGLTRLASKLRIKLVEV